MKTNQPNSLTLTPDEARALIGNKISRQTVYNHLSIRGGPIPCLRLGRKILIPRKAFDAWLDSTSGPKIAA
jgi:excisionase family DNA binding protein